MLLPLALAAALLATPDAETPPDPEFEAGRAAFQQGLRALDEGDVASAVQAFETSIAARESPPALYNLGLAYRRLGRVRDALATFERFLDLAAQKPDSPGLAHARVLAEELRAARARVSLSIEGQPTRVTVDGQPIEAKAGLQGLILDPGPHVFVADGAGGPVRAEAQLDSGAQVNLTLDVRPPAPAEVEVTPAPEPPPEAGPRWWLWAGIAAVVVAGAAVGVVAATREGDPPPFDGGSSGVVLRGLTR